MLDTMFPGTLEYWMAYDRIEGIGFRRLVHVLTQGLFRLLRKGIDPVKAKPEQIDPWINPTKGQQRAMMTPNEQLAAARSISSGRRR
jgi:hypothetical protein